MSMNSKTRYQTYRGGATHINKPIGLITGRPADVNTIYTAGAGVGSTSIFARRAKLKKALICYNNCGSFIGHLDQPNYNVNGRYTPPLKHQPWRNEYTVIPRFD